MIHAGNERADAGGHCRVVVRVDHDRGALSTHHGCGEERVEPLIASVVPKAQGRTAVLEKNAESVHVLLLGEHLACPGLRDHLVRLARVRLLNLGREPQQVRRRRPQTRGCHLGVEMPAPLHDAAAGIVPCRGRTRHRRGQRLRKAAVRHPEWSEYRALHEVGEALVRHIDHHLLHDRVAAPGVVPACPRDRVASDGFGICRGRPIQHLHQRRHRRTDAVAGKSVHGESRGVGQKGPQRNRLGRRKLTWRQLPRGERRVHMRVEVQLVLLDEVQRAECRHRFTDGASLKQGGRRDSLCAAEIGDSVGTGIELSVLQDGERESGDSALRHLREHELVELVRRGLRRERSGGGEERCGCEDAAGVGHWGVCDCRCCTYMYCVPGSLPARPNARGPRPTVTLANSHRVRYFPTLLHRALRSFCV